MSEQRAVLERLILALSHAAATHSLYPAGHPRAEAALDEVERGLQALFDAGRDHLTLLVVDDELVVDGKPWDRTASRRGGLVRALQRAEVESVRVAAGVAREEIRALVRALAGAAGAESSQGVTFARVAGVAGGGAPRAEAIVSLEQSLDAAYDALTAFRQDFGRGFARLERAVWSVIGSMAREDRSFMLLAGLERHDDSLWRHAINVSLHATRLAEALGLEGQTLHDVSLGALLHDVGYLAFPAGVAIADIPPAERRLHPERGAALLAGIEDMSALPVLVAYEHHQAWDGEGGYPEAARPPNLASQITAVADTWDTLLHAGSSLPAGPRTRAAAATLRSRAGELLHPDLVTLFLERLGLAETASREPD